MRRAHSPARMSFNARKGGKNAQAKPPEKGSFPLDHGGQCAASASEFMACLKAHGQRHAPCKALAKQYFECRMDRGLMAKEDLATMGISEYQLRQVEIASKTENLDEARKKMKKRGYTAGLRAKGFLREEGGRGE